MIAQLLFGCIGDQLACAGGDRIRVAPELVQHESVIHGMRATSDVAQLLRPCERRMHILERLARAAEHPAGERAFAQGADPGVVSTIQCRMRVMAGRVV